MAQEKNRIMIGFSFLIVLISVIVHVLHRYFNIFNNHHLGHNPENLSAMLALLLNVLFLIPILLLGVLLYSYLKKDHMKQYLPVIVTLTLTFSSISIIAGGNGMVEYHFSIFMVLAILAYYESIKLIIISTIIFAVQHFGGYFVAPELLCGSSEYHFGLLMIHAIFLVLTSVATILQIIAKKAYTEKLEKEKEIQLANLNEVLANITSTSNKVVMTSNILSENVEQTKVSSIDISNRMEEVAKGNVQQSEASKESAIAMEEMANGIQRVAELANTISEHSKDTVSNAKKGEDSIKSAVSQMQLISDSVNKIASTVMLLTERTTKIDEIIGVITAIANQTNLLALNAAIEAARAGENGKGFAVVADEVRKLAEQSQSSANEITELIVEIQTDTQEAVKAMNIGIADVSVGLEVVNKTGETFTTIVKASKNVAAQVEEMTVVAHEMSAGTEEVSASVEEVAKIANLNAESANNIATSANEQLYSLTEIADVAIALQKTSEELELLVAKFKVAE